ncbi:MAG: hypothetical protein OXH22_13430 [Chloroflexi bacterium]|nr:hypothetical protein [Chloroflexota bacterium]
MPNPDDNPGLVQDCETLLAAKDALRGDAQLNWSVDTAMSGWTGVTVGGDPSRVTSVNLANRGLSGVIPSQLGSLPSLTTLYLHRNSLTGAIPPELGTLSNLQGLYIQHNQLTGEIPSQLGDLSNLIRLYILGNQLTGCIPAALRDVQNSDLRSAGLPYCAGEPEQDSGCSNGIAVPNPDDNPGLVQDCEILLSARDVLHGDLPEDVRRRYGRQLLNWSSDTPIRDWHGIRIRGTLPRVRSIFIPYEFGSHGLYGVIPPQLGSLSNLEDLVLTDGKLTGGIPPELGKLSKLERLSVEYNQLTGEIPPELGALKNLNTLSVYYNQLTGEIPSELGNLSNLRYLNLYGNELGCVPVALFLDANLYDPPELDFCERDVLAAFYSATDGDNWTNNDKWLSDAPIGEWHGVTTDADGKVTRLALRENNLVGEISPALGALNRLEVLALDGNSLSGEVPFKFIHLKELTRLALNRNNLEDFSVYLWRMPKLSILGLAKNENLSFFLPWWLATLGGYASHHSNLTKLSLHDTDLSGSLPTHFGNLKLERLAIQNTNLSGPLPDSMTQMTTLKQFYSDGTDICVPADDDFQTWLAGVEDKDDGKNCSE